MNICYYRGSDYIGIVLRFFKITPFVGEVFSLYMVVKRRHLSRDSHIGYIIRRLIEISKCINYHIFWIKLFTISLIIS